jgi:replicative DNA helicase
MNEYGINFQKMMIRFLLQDPQLYSRVSSIYSHENFDRSLRESAEFIQKYAETYRSLPDVDQLKSITGLELSSTQIENIESKKDWALDEFEKFTKQKTLERAILKSADMLEKLSSEGKGNFDPIEKIIKDAVQIGLTRDIGTDYYENPRERLMMLKESNGQISTGLKALDEKLYGGMNRKELNIVIANSGGGKSLFMQNMAVNWSQRGLNGAYITLELKEELCCMRMDGMITDMPMKNIFKEIDDVELKVKIAAKKAGKLQVKFLPAQSNVNHIKTYLKELQIKTGMILDFLVIDYLDLMMPISVKVSPSDLFVKDKYVAEELRNLANELNVILLTACQFNRSGVDESEFGHDNIAGGISKIYTADNAFALYTSISMRERGRYSMQFLKTRNSGSVGQKIDLGFNVESLKFFDCEDGGDASRPSISSILNQVKNGNGASQSSNSGSADVVPRAKNGVDPYKVANDAINGRAPQAQVNSGKLKSMLAGLKSEK